MSIPLEVFLKRLGDDVSPENAYKIYLHTQITILKELLIAKDIVTRDVLERIEEDVLASIGEKTKE